MFWKILRNNQMKSETSCQLFFGKVVLKIFRKFLENHLWENHFPHTVSSPPFCRGPKIFSVLAKRGVTCNFWIFRVEWVKKEVVDFFRGAGDSLKVIFNCWSNIIRQKNVNYSYNHNNNVLSLLTIFKCLQLVN